MFTVAQVHFSLGGNGLVVQAQCKDTSDVLQLVPPNQLERDLPSFLIRGHVHWLNLSTSVIEIRPLRNCWKQSDEHWRIGNKKGQYYVYKDHQFLVDIRSRTWDMVSGLLKRLDYPKNLIVTTYPVDFSPTPRLSVTLPHHGLSFFVNSDGDLESDDFKEMVYDKNQDIGTLFGLKNGLILRTKAEVEEGLVPRCALISSHRITTRWKTSNWSATYYVYKVDTELGSLTGNSSWESKHFLAYLHTETSIDWRPDPLTGRTGAQEALSILCSAGYQSLCRNRESKDLYRADRDPLEDFWSNYPQIEIAATRSDESPTAMQRAKRAAYLFSPNNAGPNFLCDCSDEEPMSLLSKSDPYYWGLEDAGRTVASVAYHQQVDMSININALSNWAENWAGAVDSNTTCSPSPYAVAPMNLNLPQELLAEVQEILHEHNAACQQFRLLFLLPTFTYYSPNRYPQTVALSILLAFTKEGQQRGRSHDYKLLDGYSPSRAMLRSCFDAMQCYKARESLDQWSLMEKTRDTAVECLLKAWPSDTIPPLSLSPEIWNVAKLTCALQKLFSSCYRNLRLKEDVLCVLREAQPAPTCSCTSPHLQYTSGVSSSISSHTLQTTCVQTVSVNHHYAPPSPLTLQHAREHSSWPTTLGLLLSARDAPALRVRKPSTKSHCEFDGDKHSSPNTPTFNQLLSSLCINKGDPPFQEWYIARLHASATDVHEGSRTTSGGMRKHRIEELKVHFVECKHKYMEALCRLRDTLGATADPVEQALARCGQWPHITPYSLLGYLASTSLIKPSQDWKKCLVSFALLLLELQHARRLLRFAWEGPEEEFIQELENGGCDGWHAEEHPDWLLIQVRS